jgi:hypothetical protein
MKEADLQVKTALMEAGYEARPMGCRGALYETLEQLLREDPQGNDELVDSLRSILSDADVRECPAEHELMRQQHPFIKGCPECGSKPDVGSGYVTDTGEVLVVCMNHNGYAVVQGGKTLAEAVRSWNGDDWVTPEFKSNRREEFQL